ncbi:hypothetical protein K1T71_011897 [Dendrolimus kikuchii]|uniref:Uncharacterized protein n=1 Tax=Dendrolimus kikuchii TaxID=765133 RepID=A0ACC1CMD0_9NEOP|nr:hypothetical protein K1T71_011897 [Dendrolimus kikuchii]
MANFQYEGATDGFSDNQFKFIDGVLEKRGYTNKKVLIEAVGAAGDNYMANVKRIIVEDAQNKPFKMIAKVAPKFEKLRAVFNTHSVFYNEHVIYTELIPQFKMMQEAANLSNEDMIRFAECYGSYIEEPDELLLLEDLKELNCVMLDRLKPLPEHCMHSVLRNLAIFHSLSFVLKHKNPEFFDTYRQKLFDLWANMGTNEEVKHNLVRIEEYILNLLSDSEDRSKVIKGIITKIGDNLRELVEEETGSEHTVIRHGDAWTNNFMFRFDGDTLLETIMIDYQMSSETKPTCDLLFFIFNCTDHQTRLKHFHKWIELYHTALDRALSKFGLDAKNVYPKEKLDADLKRYGKPMCALCTFFSYLLTMNSEEAAKLKENLDNMNDVETEMVIEKSGVEFKSKVEGLIDTCLEFGLI